MGKLRSSSFSRMRLSGTLPTQFGQLTSYSSSVDVRNTPRLSGTIPVQISTLSKIGGFYMIVDDPSSPMSLSGTLPTEWSSGVTSIQLYGSSLSGTIPPELGQLSKLQYLSVFHSQLSGAIPSELAEANFANSGTCQLTYTWQGVPDTNRFSCPLPANLPQQCASPTCYTPPPAPPAAPPVPPKSPDPPAPPSPPADPPLPPAVPPPPSPPPPTYAAYALSQFYQAMNGAEWDPSRSLNWDLVDGTDVCQFSGLTCSWTNNEDGIYGNWPSTIQFSSGFGYDVGGTMPTEVMTRPDMS